jgi:phosphatidate cytidylyltransferase
MSGPLTRISIGTGLTVGLASLLVADVGLQNHYDLLWSPVFWVLLAMTLLMGCFELTRMLHLKGHPCRPGVALVFVTLLVAAAWYDYTSNLPPFTHNEHPAWVYVGVLVALVLAAFLAELVAVERRGTDVGLAAQSAAWTVLVVMTVGLPGVFIAKLWTFEFDAWRGLMYLSLFIGTVKAGDIGAYAVGSTLGRHKLVPHLSPKKSYEGLVGGLAAGTGAATALGCLWGGFGLPQMLVFGLLVSLAGVLGDLAESLLKRACGVKDSGAIPGFGGVLDILDSLLGAAPVAYLLLVVLIR